MNNGFLHSPNTKVLPSVSLCGITKTFSEHKYHMWVITTSTGINVTFLKCFICYKYIQFPHKGNQSALAISSFCSEQVKWLLFHLECSIKSELWQCYRKYHFKCEVCFQSCNKMEVYMTIRSAKQWLKYFREYLPIIYWWKLQIESLGCFKWSQFCLDIAQYKWCHLKSQIYLDIPTQEVKSWPVTNNSKVFHGLSQLLTVTAGTQL